MSHRSYTSISCKSALNRVDGMPFRWSLNPYRGCVHACHYCYARATHSYFDMNADEDFERRILVKENVVEVLARELRRPSWAREKVAIGTATDAYQPIEGKPALTRGCLQAFAAVDNPVSIVTKSTLVVRDSGLLADLGQRARVRVHFSITTLDEELWRSLEPGTPRPAQRLRALQRLTLAGVRCGVLMAPVIPGLNATPTAIDAVARAAAASGAISFAALPLRLAPLVREHFIGYLRGVDPSLAHRYASQWRGTHAPEDVAARIATLSNEASARYGLDCDDAEPVAAAATPAAMQLPMFPACAAAA